MERLKNLAIRGIVPLWLAISSPQPINSEPITHGTSDDPHKIEVTANEYLRQAMIQSIYEKYGIEIIADHDPELTAAIHEYKPDLSSSQNYSPTLEMVQTLDSTLDLIPASGFMAQKVIFFEQLRNPDGDSLLTHLGTILHNFQGEGWVVIFHDPNIPLSRRNYFGAGSIDIPDYGTRLALPIAHEFGHGLHSNVLYLQSFDKDQYEMDWANKHLNPLDPILRTYAKVAGFEFIEPEELCNEYGENCWENVRFYTHPIFRYKRNLEGWVRTPRSLNEGRIVTNYARWSYIYEAFADDFMGYLFIPNFYDPSMQRYFQNLLDGLSDAEEPGHFLLAIAQDPEGILLDGITLSDN